MRGGAHAYNTESGKATLPRNASINPMDYFRVRRADQSLISAALDDDWRMSM